MHQPWISCSLFIVLLFAQVLRTDSAATTQSASSYSLQVSVDEVILNFHAADAHGLPINDLKLDELNLRDTGKPPRKILAFELLQDFPIRAGILMDTSSSMREHLAANRAISIKYAQSLLRQQTDQAFVMNFGKVSNVVQPWTNNPILLTAGIRKAPGSIGRIGNTTAIFDAIYAACRYQFGKINHAASGNFILLFSDGEDDSSYLPLKQAVDTCQSTNTSIYAFRAETETSFVSTGPTVLAELASETGGRVFRDNDSEANLFDDLQTIEADLRNQYRLVYRPADLKHDGSFHRIELKIPERVDSIVVRSGYYAPAH
jgi:Ca-activated chloride channel homolog